MRGTDKTSGSLFSYVYLEERISPQHPLRKISQVDNDALSSLDVEFEALYPDFGRPSTLQQTPPNATQWSNTIIAEAVGI